MGEEAVIAELPKARNHHIKKRALKNKALAVSFDEKDLKDYVTGFHKRKKKRRKEAQQQIEDAQHRKRIEDRKKRKLEREFVYSGGIAPEDAIPGPNEDGDGSQQEDHEQTPSIFETTTYDNDEVKVIVTTSEISRDEEIPSERPRAVITDGPINGAVKKSHNLPAKKKPLKITAKRGSRKKLLKKREKKKGKKKDKR